MQANSESIQTEVLIVGAGPVGLSLAIELGVRGVAVTLVEKRSRTGAQPRAKTTNVRSMQHLRRWGIAEALRAAAPLPYDYPTDIVFSTTLCGRTLAVIENAFEGARRRDSRFPEPAQWVPQYTVEKVLHDRIAQQPSVRVITGAAFETFTQSAHSVSGTIRELATDTCRTIHARYLVGADGARSRVREVMGAKMTGDHAFALNYNLIVRIPELEQNPPDRRAIMYWTDRSVFLAGDACHLHPPYGGFGMNLGIADGVDLGWKLAGTLQGWGGDLLLASYEEERRAIHQRTIAAAIENYRTLSDHLVRDGLNEDTIEGGRARAEVRSAIVAAKTREFKSLGVVLGSYYENSPIIVAEGTAPPPVQHEEFQPCARPGCLAPHAWLDDGSSLYDHFGLGLSLLLLTDSGLSTARAIAKAAEDAHVPLKVLDLRSVSIAQLYEAPLALIRPDQYVAWRGADINPAVLLDTVRGAETKTTTRRTAPWERLTPTPSTSTA